MIAVVISHPNNPNKRMIFGPYADLPAANEAAKRMQLSDYEIDYCRGEEETD